MLTSASAKNAGAVGLRRSGARKPPSPRYKSPDGGRGSAALQETKTGGGPAQDHDADQQQAPDRGGEVLARAQKIEAGGEQLEDDQRQEDRDHPAETAERINAAEEAGEHGDQQIGLTVS